MSDPFNTGPVPHPGWSPFDFFLGLAGTLSPWWLSLTHAFDAIVGGIVFYGGGLLMAVQLYRFARLQQQRWKTGRRAEPMP